jgi:glycosyltransferase involved in cell wall biosynthesis
VLRRTALALPVTVGPAAWRRALARVRISEARRLARRVGDTRSAKRVVAPLLTEGPLAGRAWTVVAEAQWRENDVEGALDAARRSTARSPAEIESLVVHHRLAAASENHAEANEVLARLRRVRPHNGAQLKLALRVLVDGGEEILEQYRDALHGFDLARYDERVDEAISAVRLTRALGQGAGAFDHELKRVVARHARPAQIVVKTLIRRRAWPQLAAYLDAAMPATAGDEGSDGARVTRRVAKPLLTAKATSKALAAGRTAAAVSLAHRVLAARPDEPRAREVRDDGSDQLAVVADGWRPEPISPVRYEPRDAAVVSLLAQSLPVRSGGYATRSHGVLTGLASLGWDVCALTRLGFPYDTWDTAETRVVAPVDIVDGIPYRRLLDDGIRSYPQYPLRSYIDRYATRVAEHAEHHRAALIQASSFHVNGLAGATAARRLGLPFLYEMRGLEDLIKVSRDPAFAEAERHEFLTMLESQVCLLADRVLVITDALKHEMASRGVPEERLVVLPNGVHTARFAPRERDARLERELGVSGKTVVGYAGGLVDYEGLDLLLHAAAALREHRSDFHVVVVGDGHYERRMHREADRLRLGDVVTFTGRVPHDQVAGYLSVFDITPFPRLPLPVCELVSPIKPLEAMAMGKAAVVSSVAALTEIVRDRETGLVFEKGDARSLTKVLDRLIDDPLLRERLGDAARRWVTAERDWSAIVRIADDTYREVLSR